MSTKHRGPPPSHPCRFHSPVTTVHVNKLISDTAPLQARPSFKRQILHHGIGHLICPRVHDFKQSRIRRRKGFTNGSQQACWPQPKAVVHVGQKKQYMQAKKIWALKTYKGGSFFALIRANTFISFPSASARLYWLGTIGGNCFPCCNARFKRCSSFLSGGATTFSARCYVMLRDYYSW